jgi:hypothetical protein
MQRPGYQTFCNFTLKDEGVRKTGKTYLVKIAESYIRTSNSYLYLAVNMYAPTFIIVRFLMRI